MAAAEAAAPSLYRIRPPAPLAAAWLSLFVVGTDLFVVSPLLPLIARDYGVSPSLAGLSVTGFAFSYMLMAPLLGHLADRFGRRRLLGWCLIGFAAANLLSATAAVFATFAASRVLAGAAAAGVTPSIYALVSDGAPPQRRATWLAIAVSGLLTALSLGAPLGALVGARFGWPAVFAGFSGLSIALLWLNRRVWPEARPQQQHPSLGSAGIALAEPALGVAAQRLALTVLWSTALYGMYTYLGAGLAAAGFDEAGIAGVILCYGAGAVAGNLLGGCLADRVGSRCVIAVSLLGLAVGFLALRFALADPLLLVLGPAFAAFSAAAQLFFPAQQAGLASDFPTRRATVLAWNNAALFLGISLGSAVGGEAIAAGGFAADLAASAAIAVAAWLLQTIMTAALRPAAAIENHGV